MCYILYDENASAERFFELFAAIGRAVGATR